MWEREARLSPTSAKVPGVGLSVRIVFFFFFFFHEVHTVVTKDRQASGTHARANRRAGTKCYGSPRRYEMIRQVQRPRCELNLQQVLGDTKAQSY
eukprot:1800133-Prymnesium_polylepis.1